VVGFLGMFYILHTLVNNYTIPSIDESHFYPTKAVSYLSTHIPKGNLFSYYDWGGYLILHLPEKKVFIDGRMPSWKQDPHPGESENVFKEYREILGGTYPVKKAIKKYGITTFLLPAEETDEEKEKKKNLKFLENLFKTSKKTVDIYEQLRRAGWKIVYKDDLAAIYQKK
jgi:hypothetical protein